MQTGRVAQRAGHDEGMPMSDRTYVSDLPAAVGTTVTVAGWVRFRRSSGTKLHFLEIRDGTGSVQVVVKRGLVPEEVLDEAGRVPLESSVRVVGEVRADDRQVGGVEMQASALEIVQACPDDFPIGKKEHGAGFLFDQRHLWLRSAKPAATLRLRAHVVRACREHLDGLGFVNVDAPIFQSAAAEGTATLFPVAYFDQTVYLSQTGQLHMEAAAQALGKVYCFGPTFRAEKSKTRRHLTEFWMLEPEMSFAHLEDSMALMESLIGHVLDHVLQHARPELQTLERDIGALERSRPPFPRISYDEAVERLQGTEAAITWGEDFGAPQETQLSSAYSGPILVHRFPTKIKAFYMRPDPQRPEVALGCDLIAPEGYGEIIGGGERASDLAFLERRIAEEGLPPAAYTWYLDLRRYGGAPTAGFGMGLERVVAWLGGLGHVREAGAFPRTLNRTAP
jgi:asparaginyl-tRNA synthetase